MRELFPWLPLGLLFLAAFVDPRRPWRLAHLDLLVLAGFSAVYMRSFERPLAEGWFTLGALMVAGGLVYLAARMLLEGFRPGRADPLVPLVPLKWLAVALIVLSGLRVAYALGEPFDIFNVGGAGVIGADLIADGRELYEGGPLATEVDHGDTYGPVNYLAYVPFEQALPLEGDWREADAARAAAIGFDLLTMLALFALGRRLRRGDEGTLLGVALAYGWASYPYTLFAMTRGFNDALVALLIVGALLAVASPAGRGALLALATATKFAPAALAPLFAGGLGAPRRRPALIFAVVFTAVLVVLFLPFLPDGGPREVYDRTIGFQAGRDGCCGVLAKTSTLDGLAELLAWPAQLAALGLALLVAIRPRSRSFRQLTALAAAVIAAVQFAAPNWLPSYAVWLAPLVLLVLLVTDEDAQPRPPEETGSTGRRT